MTYFRELPDLQYQSFLPGDKSLDDYLTVKNIFRRVKIRDDLKNIFTVFTKYQIPNNVRPEVAADELYGSPQYDWVVLVSAGITRVRDQWPLTDYDLYNYVDALYGNELNDVHHWETTEIKDSIDRLILPAGKIVDQDFEIPDPSNPLIKINPVKSITNYQYEVRKNDAKRGIYVLNPIYLQQVVNEIRKTLLYDRSSQYVERTIIKTENTKATLL